jgi:hypothetical protein
VPLAPEEGVQVPLAEPLDRLRELALKGEATQLAVRDDVETGFFLKPDHGVDRAVLDALELRWSDLAAPQPLACFEQLWRPEQASDDVGARVDHAVSLRRLASMEARAEARVPL